MATGAVGKISKAVALNSVLSQNVLQRVNCLSTQLTRPAAIAFTQAISTNARPRQTLWSCSKGVQGEITIHCLKDMLVDGNIQLFDVRQPHEILEMGKIPRSVNIPLDKISAAFKMSSAEFQEVYGVPKPGVEDENIVFHCQSGRRAQKAVQKVIELGFIKANNFVGGWKEWEFDVQHQPKLAPRKIAMEH